MYIFNKCLIITNDKSLKLQKHSTCQLSQPHVTIYYSTHICVWHNKRKIYLYNRLYTTSCTFITTKYKIIHQSATDGDKTVRQETCVLCEIWSVKLGFISKVFLKMQVFWEVTLCHQANWSHVLKEHSAFIFRESQGPRPPDPCTVVVWNMGTTRQTAELHPTQLHPAHTAWII